MKKKLFSLSLGTFLFCGVQVTAQVLNFDFELVNSNFKYVTNVHGAIAKGDVDNDGDIDVFISSKNPDIDGLLYLNNGNGNFSVSLTNSFPGSDFSYSEFIDIDEDGDLDLMFMGRVGQLGQTNLYLNDGTGDFTLKQNLGIPGYHSGEFSIGDIDNDNDLDIIICGISGSVSSNPVNITKIFTNNGSEEFSELLSVNLLPLSNGSVKLIDLDNDDDLDVVCLGHNNPQFNSLSNFKTYLNNGAGFFTELQNSNLLPVSDSAISFGDSDGDGDVDFLVSGNINVQGITDNSTRLYFNNGNGLFNAAVLFPNSRIGSTNFTDFDNDGDLDLFFDGIGSTWDNTQRFIAIYENLGGNIFTQSFIQNNAPLYTKSVIADFNGDSKLDFILLGAPATQMYFNTGTLSVDENVFKNGISLYPNPTKSFIEIQFDEIKPSLIEVYNNIGAIISKTNVHESKVILNVENYSSGVYFVKITGKDRNVYVTKFIKN